MRTTRSALGLRKPARRDKREMPPRASLEQAIRVLRLIRPWAAPRLPEADLACFDWAQRQIKPLPGQSAGQWRHRRRRLQIPTQRGPHPLDRSEAPHARG